MSTQKLIDIQGKVEKELIPFGQYLILKDLPPSVQPFHLADIGLVALLVVAWIVREFVRAYVQARAQKVVGQESEKKLKQLDIACQELSRRLEANEEEIDLLKAALEQLAQICTKTDTFGIDAITIDSRTLVNILKHFGLTDRAAKRCAGKLLPMLNRDLRRLFPG